MKAMKQFIREVESDPRVLLDPSFEDRFPVVGDLPLDLSIDYDLHPAYAGLSAPGAFEALLPKFVHILRRYFRADEATKIDKGAKAYRSDETLKDRFRSLIAPQIEAVRGRRSAARPEARGVTRSSAVVAEFEAPTEAYFLLTDLLERSGTLFDIRHALRSPARLRQATVMIKDETDTNLYNVFGGEVSDPKSIYLHHDTDVGVMKVGMYLSEVGPGNGPFRYVLDSHRRRASIFDRTLRRANDFAGLEATNPISRAQFMGLPPHLRRKANLGNDLRDGTELSELILSQEKAFTSDEGDIILFDNDGLHRGGLVDEGERIVVFMLFERGDPPVRPSAALKLSKGEWLYRRQSKNHLFAFLKKHGFAPGAVFDVGFAYGTEELDDAFECPYILIDPVAESVPFMEAFQKRKPETQWFLAAASDKEGVVEISATPLITNSTLHGKGGEQRQIRSMPLDSIDAPPGPYLIKIDVEGHELEVLRGATKVLEQTEVVVVEVNLWSEDNPNGRSNIVDVINHMDRAGFVIYDMVDFNYRAADSAVAQVDMVFVKKGSPLRASKVIRTPEQQAQNAARKAARLEKAKRKIGVI